MSRSKKNAPDITRLSGLKWEKADDSGRELLDKCDFCDGKIYTGDDYWQAFSPIDHRNCGEPQAVACKSCGVAAGLEW